MSWRIGVLKNTVEVSPECAADLFAAQAEDDVHVWDHVKDVTNHRNHPTFNYDHMEQMDWLRRSEALVQVLLRHKVKGDICFGDVEGSSRGLFWGYRFEGDGSMWELEAVLEFKRRGPHTYAKPA